MKRGGYRVRYNCGRLLPRCTFADTRGRRPARKGGYLLDHCSTPHSSLIPPHASPPPPHTPLAFCAVAVRFSPPFCFCSFSQGCDSFPFLGGTSVLHNRRRPLPVYGMLKISRHLLAAAGAMTFDSTFFSPLPAPLHLPGLIMSCIIEFYFSRCRLIGFILYVVP